MIQKTDIEQAKANLAKTVRAAIRLRHSLAADAEINERLPEAELAFDRSVQQGELPDDKTLLAIVKETVDAERV